VKTVRLTSAKGFLLLDLDDAPVSVGLARSAPSILQSGAVSMARSVTYSFASFGIRAGGAQLAVNAKPDERPESIAAALEQLAPEIDACTLLLDVGRGFGEADLAGARLHDPRPSWLWEEWRGATTADYLVVAGACAAAAAAGHPVEGRRVAIEGFGPVGLALARLVADRGGSVVAVGTGSGTASTADGFDANALDEAWSASGEGMVKALGTEPKPAWTVFGADADVLFIGSKTGTLTHDGAEHVRAGAVVPIAPVPFTTKALITLERAGRTVLPDFVALAGPHVAGLGGHADPTSALEAITDGISEVVASSAAHDDGLFLGACYRAEEFLKSWQSGLPFGRPLA
jgi:glutamate dehydrogenase (NAD(P)+)